GVACCRTCDTTSWQALAGEGVPSHDRGTATLSAIVGGIGAGSVRGGALGQVHDIRGPGGFFYKAEGGIGDWSVTGVQTCALPISGGDDVLRQEAGRRERRHRRRGREDEGRLARAARCRAGGEPGLQVEQGGLARRPLGRLQGGERKRGVEGERGRGGGGREGSEKW